jgi:large subunit ribosomal protein L7/L12
VDKDQFISQLEGMTVSQINELVKALEEKFGVSVAAMVNAGVGTGAAVGAGEVAEEKDAFNVVLTNAGSQKIAVIKVLRELTGLGLKEVKDMTDNVPVTVKEDAKKADAEEMKKKLTEAGGVVELK